MSFRSNSSLETPLKRVEGLGSAHAGTEHFWRQRVTAVAGIPLLVAVLIVVVLLTGADYATARATLSQPLVALLFLLFIGTMIVHMRLGMQVIIEDYVHEELPKLALLMLNTFFAVAVGIACAFAVLKLSFGA
jgi:succinate dehydrogenase / fumarate reductase membrane anchor subunit